MSAPYIGEIRLVGFNFAPVGWAFCDGTNLAISQNTALFDLLGTTYGGDGVQTFGLPDLRGRLPIHQGNGFVQGQRAGTESHTLIAAEIPNHSHSLSASSAKANQTVVQNNVWAADAVGKPYNAVPAAPSLGTTLTAATPGGQPHENRPPVLAVNMIIALQGIFPSQN